MGFLYLNDAFIEAHATRDTQQRQTNIAVAQAAAGQIPKPPSITNAQAARAVSGDLNPLSIAIGAGVLIALYFIAKS